MTQSEILEELKKLTASDRLAVVTAALQLVQADLQQLAPCPEREVLDRRLEAAAALALPFYLEDPELTAFTALDAEDFYESE
jgi:hypothetical protein